MSRKWTIFSVVGVLSIIADQLTKWWARSAMDVGDRPISFIGEFWEWQLHWNTGSAFGLFSGARVFLTIIGVVALAAIFWMVRQARADQKLMAWALGLVGGGAIGNIIDRIAFGKVTDFVVWRYGEHAWPAFNVADVVLVVGVGLLFIEMHREKKREQAAEAEGSSDASGKGGGKAGRQARRKSKKKGR